MLIGEGLAYPQEPLHHIISRTVKKFPQAIACKYQSEILSYTALEEGSNKVATFLINNGVTSGTVVGLLMERSTGLLTTLLGILKAGGVYLAMDPEYPEDRVLYMLQDSEALILITDQNNYLGNKNVKVIDVASLALANTVATLPVVSIESPAYVLYTSGSTGRPKGVKVTHRNLVNLLMSMFNFPGMASTDKLLAVTTVSFDISNLELFLPLTAGATLFMADAATARDGKSLLRMMKQEQITFMQATPATWKLLLVSGWEEKLAIKIVSCGEPLPKDLSEKLLDRCASLWNMYGPTETTVYSTGKRILKTDKVITIGKPIGNTQIYILDDKLNPIPKGEIGEICIGGDGVTLGYFNQPDLSAQKFIDDPFKANGHKMYRTGDLGQVTNDGEILYLGRIDKQIKIRGYRIEAGEIEYLLKNIPDITDAVVTTRSDKGNELKLVAYVVLKSKAQTSDFKSLQHSFKDTLSKDLPAYMIPSEFYLLNEIPLTLNGKVDYKVLSTTISENPGAEATIAIETDLQKTLAGIWVEALDSSDFTINDNFFDIGGHSLIALYVMNAIEQQLGKNLPISTLYEFPTIKELAGFLQGDHSNYLSGSLVALKPGGDKKPLYLIHGNGLNLLNFSKLVQLMPKDRPVFGFQALGLNSSNAEIGTMEQIAAQYVKELLLQNADGPYLFAGYSYGGFIEIEMARILRNMGKEVALIALLDVNAQNSEKYDPRLTRMWNKLIRQIPKSKWFLRSLINKPVKTIGYQLSLLKGKFEQLQTLLGLRHKTDEGKVSQQIDLITNSYNEAYHNYRLKPYDCKVHLFRAKERVYFTEETQTLGWTKYALQGVEVHEVPGDHKTMLEEPNVAELAKQIQLVIEAL